METNHYTTELIDPDKRLDFMEEVLPNIDTYLYFESILFKMADKMLEGYHGGYWDIYDVTTPGGKTFFYALSTQADKVRFTGPNGSDVSVDPFAAGVGLSVMALNHTVWLTYEKKQKAAQLADLHYNRLRDFMFTSSKIGDEDLQGLIAFLD